VVGLGLGHTGSHIVSAAVEAVCFQLAGGLADVESISGGTLEILANGGAIDRSEWWKRRLASTLGRPVHYPTAPETTARGAAAIALGVDLGHAEEEELVTPVPDDVAHLALARQHWATWYEQLLPITSATRA
jgi:sugar (pentulose or hexulose) kinase